MKKIYLFFMVISLACHSGSDINYNENPMIELTIYWGVWFKGKPEINEDPFSVSGKYFEGNEKYKVTAISDVQNGKRLLGLIVTEEINPREINTIFKVTIEKDGNKLILCTESSKVYNVKLAKTNGRNIKVMSDNADVKKDPLVLAPGRYTLSLLPE